MTENYSKLPVADDEIEKTIPHTADGVANSDSGDREEQAADAANAENNKGKWQLRCGKIRRPGWKWVVLIGAFAIRCIFNGFLSNYTTLSVKLRGFYGTNEQLLGWVGSVALSTRSLCSPLTAAIAVKIGYRSAIFLGVLLGASSLMLSSFVSEVWWYFLTFSILYGAGMALATFSSYDYLMSYFHKEFVRGTGFMAIASSTGLMISAPVMESLLESIGLQNTLRIFSGFILITAVAAFTFRPSPAEKRRMSVIQTPIIADLPSPDLKGAPSPDQKTMIKPPVHTKKTFKETMAVFSNLVRSPDMWILNLISLTLCLASTFTYLNMVSFLNSIGLSVKTSAFTLSMMGVGEFAGTALSTLLGDRVPLLRMEVLAIVSLAAAMVTAALTVVTVYPGVLTLVIAMGICRSIYNLMLFPAVIESMGKCYKLESCSLSSLMCGVGYLPGGVIGGALYDATGSYLCSLLVCVALYLITVILLVWGAYRLRRSKRLNGQMMSQLASSSDGNGRNENDAPKEVYVVDMFMTTV